MANDALRRAIPAHLGPDAAGPGLTSMQDYRSVMVTAHRVHSTEWRWTARPTEPRTTAVVFATAGTMTMGGRPPEDGAGLIIDSTHSAAMRWAPDSTATVVWFETRSLVEGDAPLSPSPIRLRRTALACGLQAFAESLTQQPDVQTSVSEYVVDRLLVEMTHGAVLEHRDAVAAQRQALRPLHRARMLLLLNRTDPDYGTSELARDMHVSTRQLQRLFAKEDSSPAAELRDLRAQLALSLLRDRNYDHLTTGQIAAHAGFSNAPAMRRGLHAIAAPTPQAARAD